MTSTVPAKSQPLHNFTLPRLKWNKDGDSGGGHHQRRRTAKSPLRRSNPSSASPLRQSPLRDSVSATSPHRQNPLRDSQSPSPISLSGNPVKPSPILGGEPSKPSPVTEFVRGPRASCDSVKKFPSRCDLVRQHPKRDFHLESEALEKNKGGVIEYKRTHSRNFAFGIKEEDNSLTSELSVQKSAKKRKVAALDEEKIAKSKILIKFPCNSNPVEDDKLEESQKISNNDEEDETDEIGEEGKIKCNDEETKTWNLRPRKPAGKSLNVNGAGVKINGTVTSDKNKAQSPPKNTSSKSGENEGDCVAGGEKKEKRKLSVLISLSKEEIEEDIFSLTGSKPARRPKKRAKNVQKQVDFVVPGQWLVSITPDSYKVSENYVKG